MASTMASIACCLDQTLVQQSQEEAEWFQFCQPAVKTKKEGKASLSLTVSEKGIQSSDSTYVDRSFTGCIHLSENKAKIEDEWFTLLLSLIQLYNVMFVKDRNMNGDQMAMLLWYQHLCHSCHLLHLLCPQWPANKAHTTICWVCFHSEQKIPAWIQLNSNFVHLN